LTHLGAAVPRAKPLRKAEIALRDFALKYPTATEDHPWGHIAVKVKGKMFLVLGGVDDRLTVTTKLPSSGKMALLLPFASPTGYGMGKSGWVTAEFQTDEPIPLDRLYEWIDESYRAVAPKKLVAELDHPEEAKPPAKKRKK
jgi:predicted DNA-binding protein (MmcQ/YjbR family)